MIRRAFTEQRRAFQAPWQTDCDDMSGNREIAS